MSLHKRSIISIIDVKKTTTWEESGFPSEFLAQRCWGGGLWTAITVYHGTKRPEEEEVIQGGARLFAGARFRIPVQNPAGARGSGLVGRDLLAPRPSGWSTGFLS